MELQSGAIASAARGVSHLKANPGFEEFLTQINDCFQGQDRGRSLK